MHYVVFKWHFLTDVRFGGSKGQLADSGYIMHSDTLFSALCLEAKKQGGDAALDKFYQLCHNKQLLLSDTMPYQGETYFLPKPILKTETKQQCTKEGLQKIEIYLSRANAQLSARVKRSGSL